MVRVAARRDVIAGLCVAGLLLPEAVAYAGLAHLPVSHGLAAVLVGLAVYALLGGSRFAVVSPTSSTATLAMAAVVSFSPSAVSPAAYAQGVMALVLLCGMLLAVLGLTGQGQLSSFVSRPVLRGFAFALAVSIVVRQLPDALGFTPPPGLHRDPASLLFYCASQPGVWHVPSLAIALAAGVLLTLLRRWPVVPASLLVMVLAIGVSHWGALDGLAIEAVGPVAAPAFRLALPDLPTHEWLRAGELAFGLVMLVFAESWGSMRSLALIHGDTLNPNRELMALGAANMVSGLFQGMPVGAGFSASAANAAAGAVSRWAGAVAWLAVAVATATALPWIQLLPRPVLAVTVISALWHVLSPAPIQAVWRTGRDRALLLAAVVAVLAFGVLDGMLVAVGLSILAALRRFSQPVMHELGELGDSRNYVDALSQEGVRCLPGVLVLRPEGPLFFGSAERVMAQVVERVQGHPGIRTVVLSLEESADLDSTAIDCLRELKHTLGQNGQQLVLARVKSLVRDLLVRVDPSGLGVSDRMFWSVADAVASVTGTGTGTGTGIAKEPPP